MNRTSHPSRQYTKIETAKDLVDMLRGKTAAGAPRLLYEKGGALCVKTKANPIRELRRKDQLKRAEDNLKVLFDKFDGSILNSIRNKKENKPLLNYIQEVRKEAEGPNGKGYDASTAYKVAFSYNLLHGQQETTMEPTGPEKSDPSASERALIRGKLKKQALSKLESEFTDEELKGNMADFRINRGFQNLDKGSNRSSPLIEERVDELLKELESDLANSRVDAGLQNLDTDSIKGSLSLDERWIETVKELESGLANFRINRDLENLDGDSVKNNLPISDRFEELIEELKASSPQNSSDGALAIDAQLLQAVEELRAVVRAAEGVDVGSESEFAERSEIDLANPKIPQKIDDASVDRELEALIAEVALRAQAEGGQKGGSANAQAPRRLKRKERARADAAPKKPAQQLYTRPGGLPVGQLTRRRRQPLVWSNAANPPVGVVSSIYTSRT
jgi:hypothetical protein